MTVHILKKGALFHSERALLFFGENSRKPPKYGSPDIRAFNSMDISIVYKYLDFNALLHGSQRSRSQSAQLSRLRQWYYEVCGKFVFHFWSHYEWLRDVFDIICDGAISGISIMTSENQMAKSVYISDVQKTHDSHSLIKKKHNHARSKMSNYTPPLPHSGFFKISNDIIAALFISSFLALPKRMAVF